MRREYRLYPLFEPPKMRACPSHHPVTVSSLSWLTTHRPFLKGCSTAVRAAGEVFASPGRLPDATSYRAVAAGASAGAQKVCHRRQGSNSCLICPLPCAAHALCGPFRGGRYSGFGHFGRWLVVVGGSTALPRFAERGVAASAASSPRVAARSQRAVPRANSIRARAAA